MTEWGQGYLVLDYLTFVAAWFAAFVNSYQAWNRHLTRRGFDRLMRRFVAVAFVGMAIIMTRRFVQFDGDLPSSPEYNVLFMLLAAGSTGIGLSRIKTLRRYEIITSIMDRTRQSKRKD